MATKLKNLRLTSVDLVKAGANQEADICIYKSADEEGSSQEAPETPTETEKNIFKRFLGWLRENPVEDVQEDESPIEEPEDPADVYKSAFTESIQSIVADTTLSEEERTSMIEKSISQYHDKMVELAMQPDEGDDPYIPGYTGGVEPPQILPTTVEKTDRYDTIREIESKKA